MSSIKVIVVGCGIAGTVVAIMLKLKGYEPVIYERGARSPDAGLSLMLQLNGLRILSLIPGLVEQLPGMPIEQAMLYSVVPSDIRLLGQSNFPADLRSEFGYGLVGVRRPNFLTLLTDTAIAHGIDVHFERQVVDVEQIDDSVRVRLNTGETDTASFVIGCDGLHSNVRQALFGKENATFTGLTQTGGISPNPAAFGDMKPSMFNFYGDGLHVIAYPISETRLSWALTRREPEAKETWHPLDEAARDEVRNGPLSQIPHQENVFPQKHFPDAFGAGDLVRNAEKITKYGLYDRPELKSWHKGRVVLIGDAAHPTSPHLGQGANQAFEDVYHLIRLLMKHYPKPSDPNGPSTAVLETIFTELEALRIERTAALVQGARKMGERRVVNGEELALARNDAVAAEWLDGEAILLGMKKTLGAEEWEGWGGLENNL
ncbi:FAD/NAD(P)-binding domain-containing protein [Mycena sp. CBHHK59/15]|nr:FAD/NAD(P)-binding domain-containing protein [Mycena sp. CBHHK59/15]